jgi:transcriptional regulator of acetoin/glycerol metabolism
VALGNGSLIDVGDLPPSIAKAGFGAASAGLSETAGESGAELARSDRPRTELSRSDGSRPALSPDSGLTPLSTTDLEDIERATIQRVFEQVNGDKALAGRMLGISRATLYRKLKRYNITGNSSAGSPSHTLQ